MSSSSEISAREAKIIRHAWDVPDGAMVTEADELAVLREVQVTSGLLVDVVYARENWQHALSALGHMSEELISVYRGLDKLKHSSRGIMPDTKLTIEIMAFIRNDALRAYFDLGRLWYVLPEQPLPTIGEDEVALLNELIVNLPQHVNMPDQLEFDMEAVQSLHLSTQVNRPHYFAQLYQFEQHFQYFTPFV